jgi:twitching motility protein PilT
MQTFNQALATAHFQKQISLETALIRSSNPDELQEMINRGAGLGNRTATGTAAGAAKR